MIKVKLIIFIFAAIQIQMMKNIIAKTQIYIFSLADSRRMIKRPLVLV